MPLVKKKEFKCTIEITKGDGELISATLDVLTDPISTADITKLGSIYKNETPFIMEHTMTNDETSRVYPNGSFNGIATVGSGKGATLNLVFDNPVNSFVINFNSGVPSMPTSMTINGTTYENNDFKFIYSSGIKSATYTIVINEMNIVNGKEMPLVIDSIENRVVLNYDLQKGLLSTRVAHKIGVNVGFPEFGVIAQEGEVQLLDFDGEIQDVVDIGALKANSITNSIYMYADNQTIGKYVADTYTANNTRQYSISLADSLTKWQDAKVLLEYDNLETNGYLFITDFFEQYITPMFGDELVIGTETENYLSQQVMLVPLMPQGEDTVWNIVDSFGKAFFIYIYKQYDGKVRLLSQYELEKRKSNKQENDFNTFVHTNNASNPIVVPYNCIKDLPTIDKLSKNFYDGFSCSSYNFTAQSNWFLVSEHSLTITKATSSSSSYREFIVGELDDNFETIQLSRPTGSHDKEYIYMTQGFVTFTKDNYLSSFEDVRPAIHFKPTNVNEEDGYFSGYQYNPSLIEKYNGYKENFSWDLWTEWENGTMWKWVEMTKYKTQNSVTYAVLINWEVLGSSLLYKMPVTNAYNYNLIRLDNIDLQLYSAGETFETSSSQFGNNNYETLSLQENMFMSNYSYIAPTRTPLPDYLYNELITKFNGKPIMTFTMASVNLFDKSGNLYYNFNKDREVISTIGYTIDSENNQVNYQTDKPMNVGETYTIVFGDKYVAETEMGIAINGVLLRQNINEETIVTTKMLEGLDSININYICSTYIDTTGEEQQSTYLYYDNGSFLRIGDIIQLYKTDRNGERLYDKDIYQVYSTEISKTGYPFVTIVAVGI